MRIFIYSFSILCFIFSSNLTYASEVLEIELILKDHKFNQELVEVPKGRKIRLTIKNEDPTVEEFDSIDLNREKIIPGNSAVHIILAPLKPGKYCFMGEFHSDTATGCLVVNDN